MKRSINKEIIMSKNDDLKYLSQIPSYTIPQSSIYSHQPEVEVFVKGGKFCVEPDQAFNEDEFLRQDGNAIRLGDKFYCPNNKEFQRMVGHFTLRPLGIDDGTSEYLYNQIKKTPDDIDLNYQYFYRLVSEGRLEDAVDYLGQLLINFPIDNDGNFNEGKYLRVKILARIVLSDSISQHIMDSKLEEKEKAIGISEKIIDSLSEKDDGKEILESLLRKLYLSTLSDLINKTDIVNRDRAKLLNVARQAYKKFPEQEEIVQTYQSALIDLAFENKFLHRYKEAKELYEECLKFFPEDIRAKQGLEAIRRIFSEAQIPFD